MSGQDDADDGIALCLSGGGYRSMLFHVGCLWRLNEVGWLPRLRCISSVSAGAITAGALAVKWRALRFDSRGIAQGFEDAVVCPLRSLASETLDQWCLLGSAFSPMSAAAILADAFDEYLFGGSALEDIPAEQRGVVPRFVFSATNLQSGALFSFSRSRLWDWRHGDFPATRFRLALAVGAASSLVPMFSSLVVENAHAGGDAASKGDSGHGSPQFTAVLTDGAVLDPLALEAVWRLSCPPLVCDGGQCLPDGVPKTHWFEHTTRVLTLMHEQARAFQRARLPDALSRPNTGAAFHDAAYCALDVSPANSFSMRLPTRYVAIDDDGQEELINRGYEACDVAIRRWDFRDVTIADARVPYAANALAGRALQAGPSMTTADPILRAGAVQCPPA